MFASGLDNRLFYSTKHTKGKDFSRLTKQFYGFFSPLIFSLNGLGIVTDNSM